jgi:hypothetical protein
VDEGDGSITVIKAHAPLSTVQTYQRDLKSPNRRRRQPTRWRCTTTPPCRSNEQQKILAVIGKKHEAED